jgi:hypothetical protein
MKVPESRTGWGWFVAAAVLVVPVVAALFLYRGWALWFVWNRLLPPPLTITEAVILLLGITLFHSNSTKKDDREEDVVRNIVWLLWPLVVVGVVAILT